MWGGGRSERGGCDMMMELSDPRTASREKERRIRVRQAGTVGI